MHPSFPAAILLILAAASSSILAQTCGGIANLQCPSGLACVLPPGPTFPDKAGTCQSASAYTPSIPANGNLHAKCGGVIHRNVRCGAGLYCKTKKMGHRSKGTCEPLPNAKIGERCGKDVGGRPCITGLKCVLQPQGYSQCVQRSGAYNNS